MMKKQKSYMVTMQEQIFNMNLQCFSDKKGVI